MKTLQRQPETPGRKKLYSPTSSNIRKDFLFTRLWTLFYVARKHLDTNWKNMNIPFRFLNLNQRQQDISESRYKPLLHLSSTYFGVSEVQKHSIQ